MNLFIEIISGGIALVSLGSAIITIVKAKKAGQPIPWDKVRPIAIEAFNEVKALITANSLGLQDVEDFVVAFILNRVDVADFLNGTEKAILSEGLIRSIVAPGLKELHEKLNAPAPVEAPAPEQK